MSRKPRLGLWGLGLRVLWDSCLPGTKRRLHYDGGYPVFVLG